jgi:hypothetical protein
MVTNDRASLKPQAITASGDSEREITVFRSGAPWAVHFKFVKALCGLQRGTTIENIESSEEVDLGLHLFVTCDNLLVNQPCQKALRKQIRIAPSYTLNVVLHHPEDQPSQSILLSHAVTIDKPDQL